ncbi:glycosyltransferase family 39 protein [Magnetospirillum gryphiswaldense]|uniref:Uncharacterized protein n=1 Tax=Magnetospirillum gryphiswaldense TaxID=55518 RepID=A4U155_9PROT|nr:glycosyltransferase family 39 protein [Magnetospirillum gryphiswaldense]AVM75607.1 hypothetical protein MSR1_31410 [Magnetospirillum gryphiswaldense MSR-1]AVM79510.1 hypothetical protein MSR1L_31410 [Magnetospirillum gryphiswaldense]CAM76612.1 conserved hypothetical protein, membrane [Magnetospirillum gryphiswaldense MSR-1]
MMTGVAMVLTMVAVFGLGGYGLRLLRLADGLDPLPRLGLAWGLGFGLLGWILFPLALVGLIDAPVMAVILIISASGIIFLRPFPRWEKPGPWGWVVLAAMAAALSFDLVEAVAPPVDGDSLTYHFLRPKEMLANHAIHAVARAVDGATPLLVQMTYLAPLSLGGERAMTLWTGLSGWLALLPMFALARYWLSPSWSLALVVLAATVPAWVYGAGAGQVEARLAAFVLVAAYALARWWHDRRWSFVILLGLAAGFYAGGKFFGLVFAALCVAFMLGRGAWRPALAVAMISALAGGQWYLFHWVTLGDPFFPLSWPYLGDDRFWDLAHQTAMKTYHYASETAVPASLPWLIAYPVAATFAPYPIWEAARTGLGPAPLLLAPFAIVSAWRWRRQALRSPLLVMAMLMLAFYVVWFLTGTTQRIRHLLPLLPVVLLVLGVAAQRGGRKSVAIGLAAVIILQLVGHMVFAVNYIQRVAAHEGRDDFLRRTLVNYDAALWLNAHLGPNDKVLIGERQLLYYLQVPYYFGQLMFQAQINLLSDSSQPEADLLADMRELGITHVLIDPHLDEPGAGNGLWRAGEKLHRAGCADLVDGFKAKFFLSRTLGLGAGESHFDVLRLRQSCAAGTP